jgi:hypothetical protein
MRFANTTRKLLVAAAGAAVLVGLAGCATYRAGSLMHPQVKTVAVGEFSNATDVPQLGPWLRQRLADQFMLDGSLRLTTLDRADIVVSGRITDVTMAQIAAVKARSDRARADDRNAYQGEIYRTEVSVQFDTTLRRDERTVLPRQTVRGHADFPRLPDIEMARQDSLKQATVDAAARIVAQITEAW